MIIAWVRADRSWWLRTGAVSTQPGGMGRLVRLNRQAEVLPTVLVQHGHSGPGREGGAI